jgi:hypothetical protein
MVILAVNNLELINSLTMVNLTIVGLTLVSLAMISSLIKLI